MIYNEDDIKEKLNSQSANVDTGQLWNDLKHHAPIKKNRKWLPFLFVFTLGGILSAAMFHFFFRTPCVQVEGNSKVVIDSLMSENKYLQEKLSTALLKIDDLHQEVSQTNKIINKKPIQHRLWLQNNIESNASSTLSADVSKNTTFTNVNISQTEPNIIRQADNIPDASQKTAMDVVAMTNPLQVDTVTNKKDMPEIPVPTIYPKQAEDKWKYYLGFFGGVALVTDKQFSNDGNDHSTVFSPFFSYSADMGLTRKIKGRFSFGAFINYNHMIYRMNYHNKLVENISLVDTTEISISGSGEISVVTGNTGGIKITEQKGKIHGYQHSISIIPSIHYQSVVRGKFHLFHDIGLGVDLMHISKNIIPTYDERSFLTQNVRSMTFKPYVRVGTRLEYIISKDLRAALLMQCTYRNENYNFSSYNGNRSSIFPSMGLGLTFK
jgi:hypothetical protein